MLEHAPQCVCMHVCIRRTVLRRKLSTGVGRRTTLTAALREATLP